MEIKPVIAKKPPEYPTEYLFINNPELFKRYIPLRWYKNKLVCTALSVFIVAGGTESFSQTQQPTTEIIDQNGTDKPLKETQNDSVKVAPIFVHGDGSGAVGCMVISHPVFITESEAIQIISEELQAANIAIDTKNCPIINFEAEAIANNSFADNKVRIASINMKIDGIDKVNKFMIEFISTEDYLKFKSVRLPSDSEYVSRSNQGFYTKRAAELFREELLKNGEFNSVIFYDPLYVDEDEYNLSDNFTLAKSKQLLVAQVQDFINWLKAEEIIK